MKRINYIIVLLLFIVGVSSCKKSFFDINNNPNQTASASYQLVLPAALNSVASTVSDGLEFSKYWMGFWAVSGGYAPNISEVTFKFSNTYYQGLWSSLYYAINNLNYVEQSAKSNKDDFYTGISKTMKVYCYQNLVDIYGNIPYSQALQISTYPRPKYDDAASIYKDLFLQLDTARNLIENWTADKSAAPTSSSDVMFKGKQVLWLKFINTLELRLLVRFTGVTKPSYYANELALVNNDPNGFLGVGQGAFVNPGYASDADAHLNPFYFDYGFSAAGNQATNYGFYRANSYGVNFFSNTNDPRIQFFYAPYTGSKYAGNDFGVQGSPNNVVSGIGVDANLVASSNAHTIGIINSPTQPSPVLTSFESLFLQAEAAKRGLISSSYASLFKLAVKESFTYAGLDTSLASKYYSQNLNLVNIDVSTDPLMTILTQKWAAVNVINPLEVYADYRRTKIPSDVPGSLNPGAGAIPLRLYYPNSEVTTNPASVAAQGTISLNNKIFWIP